MEFWDLFDENRNPCHIKHRRGEEIPAGKFHIVVEIWTVNSKNEVLLTLRDPQKEMFPNEWEVTGGSVLSGETSLQGAVRELFEETGIKASEDELTLLDSFQSMPNIYDVYLLRLDISLHELKLQEGETVDAKWVSMPNIVKMIEDESLTKPTGKRFLAYKGLLAKQFCKAKDKVTCQIAALASKYKEIQKVVLFGSRARNEYHLNSDYDFAIFSDLEISPIEQEKFTFESEESIETLLQFDFVFINEKTDKNLLSEIAKDGIVVYEKLKLQN